ncbi:MAG: hypothetical protein ABI193_15820 [Minicystis sp.]
MNDPQGGNPPGPPPAGAYGPGHTILGEPAFADESAPAAFPLPQGGTPPGPMAGAYVPPTILDPSAGYGAAMPPPSPYGAPPPAYGAQMPPPSPYGAPPPAYGANPYAAPAPNPYAPIPQAPPQRRGGGAQGPSLLIIGLAAFALIGGVVTFVALRSRASTEDSDKAIPTIDVPPPATVPADPGTAAEPPPTDPGAATEPPAAPPPPVATAPSKPAPITPKPTSTVPGTPTPKPSGSSLPPPQPSSHPPPVPTPSSKPSPPGTAKGPFLGPRKKK